MFHGEPYNNDPKVHGITQNDLEHAKVKHISCTLSAYTLRLVFCSFHARRVLQIIAFLISHWPQC